MSQHNATYQQQHTVSIRRQKLLDVALLKDLDETDYRVFLILLTQLDGFKLPLPGDTNCTTYKDPLNFKKIDVEQIANTLGIKKKEVKKSLELLYNLYLIEKGDNETVKNGYRFTF